MLMVKFTAVLALYCVDVFSVDGKVHTVLAVFCVAGKVHSNASSVLCCW